MVNESITNILIIFIVVSFLAWIFEFSKNNLFPKKRKLIDPGSFKIFKKKFINPGFLRGPYLPIYGLGALVIIGISFLEITLFSKLILFFFSNMIVELVSGKILLNYFNVKLWQYNKSDYNGICFSYSICFFIASILFYFYIFPHYYTILNFIKSSFLIYVVLGFYFFFFKDVIIKFKELIKHKKKN